MTNPRRRTAPALGWAASILVLAVTLVAAGPPSPPATSPDPFARFDLPDDWEAKFWSGPDARALLALDPKAVADLVPKQAGVRYCRCPACDAPEADDPLAWSVGRPGVVTCERCGVRVPNAKFPARQGKEKEVPEEEVEVLPGVTHHYPYHEAKPEHQRYPGERLYLAAKRDYEAREFLARFALYAAVRYHEQPAGRKDAKLARDAAILLVRFAQVYPAYATHFDQPSSPKVFQQADLPPPYRRGYKTAKWDWTGSLDVPLNLVVAYALIRGGPEVSEAGRLLKVPDPARAIERDLFRASATFVRHQPEEAGEAALQADRGILAVGRLLNDPPLVHDALARLDRFAERGFYHDGFWRQGTLASHRRVLGQLDGWIDRLTAGYADPPGEADPRGGRRIEAVPGVAEVPMLALAHAAGSAPLSEPRASDVRLASWPSPAVRDAPRTPALLGGTGLARLAVGRGEDALDIELRGLDSFAPDSVRRQALRVAVGGRTVLGDLDESPGLPTGFDLASASRNTVVVDGLNQRESPARAREPAPGGNFAFFAADPDFQVVTLDDPRAYPESARRYRQTVVVSAVGRSRYALSVFEAHGGLQHDQLFHAPAGSPARWRLSVPTTPGPATLLPPGLTFLPQARAEDGRWFVQSYGEFHPLGQALIKQPAQAVLAAGADSSAPGTGVRLHLLGDTPYTAVTATSPDPTRPARPGEEDGGRGSLILRRRSADGSTLQTTFVTLFEPLSAAASPLKRVGRVASAAAAVVVYVEADAGPEHLVVNLTPGKPVSAPLADGRTLTTDGLAVRVTGSGLALAGGTFVECAGASLRQRTAGGRITGSVRRKEGPSRGWFEAGEPLPDPETLAGRALLVRHGDGTIRGWTLERVENARNGARLFVREEPGFTVDETSGIARYYQFPQTTSPGPHDFRVSRIVRGVTGSKL